MEAIQRQILELNYKVDQLYHIIESLSSKMDILLKEYSKKNPSQPTVSNSTSSVPKTQGRITEHKDILLDDEEREGREQKDLQELLSPDVQIQRLTAQLTASYHRIAALEEQLLTVRTHHN